MNNSAFPPDIRWKQRFQNFRRAFCLLREAIEGRNLEDYSDLEREGIVQRFEYTFELGWKTFKDYLEFSGVTLTETTPKKVIKECAAVNIFREADINPEIFMDMMLARNALSHTYDFEQFTALAVKKEWMTKLVEDVNRAAIFRLRDSIRNLKIAALFVQCQLSPARTVRDGVVVWTKA